MQTGNFGVEFGRAGGGVFNVVTKSGTNSLHGTLLWRYQSQRFNSVSNVDKLNGTPKSVFSRNVYGFTLGGPVRREQDILLRLAFSRTRSDPRRMFRWSFQRKQRLPHFALCSLRTRGWICI